MEAEFDRSSVSLEAPSLKGKVRRENIAFSTARDKWGNPAMDAGFQVLPDVLFRAQKILELEATDVVILLNITMHWWTDGELPYPRPSIIAKRMALSTRTVERRISELQRRGLLERLPAQQKKGKTIRPYDLSGLVKRLDQLAGDGLKLRRASQTVERSTPPTMESMPSYEAHL